MWKSDKNETFDVLFILFDVLIFVVVINYSFSTFWSTQKTFSTFWFRRSDQLKRPFRRSEIFGLSTFWSSTFRPPPLKSIYSKVDVLYLSFHLLFTKFLQKILFFQIDVDLLTCPVCETYKTIIPARLEIHMVKHGFYFHAWTIKITRFSIFNF
jgi:hypothetical protein